MARQETLNRKKSIQLWNTRVQSLSRVWLCGQCGAKIFCGHPAERPNYRCFCGQAAWQNYNGCNRPNDKI